MFRWSLLSLKCTIYALQINAEIVNLSTWVISNVKLLLRKLNKTLMFSKPMLFFLLVEFASASYYLPNLVSVRQMLNIWRFFFELSKLFASYKYLEIFMLLTDALFWFLFFLKRQETKTSSDVCTTLRNKNVIFYKKLLFRYFYIACIKLTIFRPKINKF